MVWFIIVTTTTCLLTIYSTTIVAINPRHFTILQVILPDTSELSTISEQILGFASGRSPRENAKFRPGVSTVWTHCRGDKACQPRHLHRGCTRVRKRARNAITSSTAGELEGKCFPCLNLGDRKQTAARSHDSCHVIWNSSLGNVERATGLLKILIITCR